MQDRSGVDNEIDVEPESVPSRGRLGLGIIALLATGNGIGWALTPYLLVNHPLLLVVLAPELALLVLIGAQVGLAPMLLVGVPRRLLGLGAAYLVGRGYGAPALVQISAKTPRAKPLLKGIERALRRVGAPLLFFFPSSALTLVAGTLGLGARPTFVSSTLGSTVLLLLLHHAGEAVTEWVDALKGLLATHIVGATAVSVVVALLYAWGHRRRGSH